MNEREAARRHDRGNANCMEMEQRVSCCGCCCCCFCALKKTLPDAAVPAVRSARCSAAENAACFAGTKKENAVTNDIRPVLQASVFVRDRLMQNDSESQQGGGLKQRVDRNSSERELQFSLEPLLTYCAFCPMKHSLHSTPGSNCALTAGDER